MPLPVCAVVVNYNAGAWLARCIQSLLDNGVAEVRIVDNGSEDGSAAELAQQFAAPLVEQRLHIHMQEQNLGFGRACNVGAALTEQPHILFINPDCVAHSGSIALLLQTLQNDHHLGMVGGLILNEDGSIQPQGHRLFPSLAALRGRPLWTKNAPVHEHYKLAEAISGSCMLMRTTDFRRLGAFDEAYALHCEDLDLCWQVHASGLGVAQVPGAVFTHAKGVCSTRNLTWIEVQKHKGMARFLLKNKATLGGSPWAELLAPLVALGLAAHLLVRLTAFRQSQSSRPS